MYNVLGCGPPDLSHIYCRREREKKGEGSEWEKKKRQENKEMRTAIPTVMIMCYSVEPPKKQGASRAMTATHGSGQAVFEISNIRIGSGRVGSCQEAFKLSRIGSRRRGPARPDLTRSERFDPSRPDGNNNQPVTLHPYIPVDHM